MHVTTSVFLNGRFGVTGGDGFSEYLWICCMLQCCIMIQAHKHLSNYAEMVCERESPICLLLPKHHSPESILAQYQQHIIPPHKVWSAIVFDISVVFGFAFENNALH